MAKRKKIGCECAGMNFIDITGQTFGHAKVLYRDNDHIQPNGRIKVCWRCQCLYCGNEFTIQSFELRHNEDPSCGCQKGRKISEKRKKLNKFDFKDDYVVGYTSNKNEIFYVDKEDYEKIKKYTWYSDGHDYIKASVYDTNSNKERSVFLHRFIMLDEKDWDDLSIQVDHINGHESRNDNRKSNLRVCSSQENHRNLTYKSNSKSGFIGVSERSYEKRQKNWRAYITVSPGTQTHLGDFDNFTDAVEARIEGEIKYFGEYSYKTHKKVLDYIKSGGKLEPYNREQIEEIMEGA